MQKPTDLAAIALNITPLDLDGNQDKIKKVLAELHQRFSDQQIPLLLFPELTVTGHCADFTGTAWLREAAWNRLKSLQADLAHFYALFGIPSKTGNSIPVLYADGEFQTLSTETVWDIGGVKLAFLAPDAPLFSFGKEKKPSISPDKNPGPAVRTDSAPDLIFSQSAQVFTFGSQQQFEGMAQRLTGRSGVLFASADYIGNEAGTDLYGGNLLFAQQGRITARSERFNYADFSILTYSLTTGPDAPLFQAVWETEGDRSFEEFPRAVAVGLFDYMRKSRSGGLTLSLSGGADSAAIAVIIRLMVLFGCRAAGQRAFLEKIAYISAVKPLWEQVQSGREIDEKKIVAAILTTVYQATAHSGNVTRTAAEKIAQFTGSVHYHFNIDPIVESYKKMAADAAGVPLSWEKDDLALQNIQARTRGPGVWLLANRTNSLLLSTGNRSEAAVGYMTMDGDTCGCLSPISGVSKAFLRRWLRWMETVGTAIGKDESGIRFRIPELSYINEQQPTAELRPPEAGQTDEADLMPYTVLDIIEKGMVVQKRTGQALFDFVREKMRFEPDLAQATDEQVWGWIEKFARHFTFAAWKRRRSAPGFRLDTYTLAPGDHNDLPILAAKLPVKD